MELERELVIGPSLRIPHGELTWRFSRSGGPGGQAVNTQDTRVELRFDVLRSPSIPPHLRQRIVERLAARLQDGALVIVASSHRSQWKNRGEAVARLRTVLVDACAPPAPPRRATTPTKGSKRRRMEDKRRRSDLKRQRRSSEE